jgi:uncharacterized protein YndB with AHSA1/START domain
MARQGEVRQPTRAYRRHDHQETRRTIVASLYREFDVDAPVEKVWAAISDRGAPNKLITFLGEVTLVGDRRTCELGDMGKLEELIVTVDEENRRVVYSIRESPYNMIHHSASMQTFPNGNDGRSSSGSSTCIPTRRPTQSWSTRPSRASRRRFVRSALRRERRK